jgi:hypothetical protein
MDIPAKEERLNMEERLRGLCHCGAISLTLPKETFGVVACHCDDCQKFHGNFFAMLVVDRDALIWEGESAKNITWYASSPKARRTSPPNPPLQFRITA